MTNVKERYFTWIYLFSPQWHLPRHCFVLAQRVSEGRIHGVMEASRRHALEAQ